MFRKILGFKDCHFGQFETINARLGNRSKLVVEGNSFAINSLLIGVISTTLFFICHVVDYFHKNLKRIFFLYLVFSCYCYINLKRQSNVQDLALIRAVLFHFRKNSSQCTTIVLEKSEILLVSSKIMLSRTAH